MKRGRKANSANSDVSADVAYAEIFAEVQRLQALLNDVGQNNAEPPKQRKKRTMKPKQDIIGSAQVDAPVESTASTDVKTENISSVIEDATEDNNQQQMQSEEMVGSVETQPEMSQQDVVEPNELTQQEIQVESLKENLDKVEEPQGKAVVHKPRYVVSNLEEIRARERAQQEEDDDPFAPIKNMNTEAKTQESPSAIDPQEQIGKDESPTAEQATGNIEGIESKDLQEGKPVGYADEMKNERLAKVGVDSDEKIEKAKLDHDKSGSNWGGWAETPADEIESPDSPK